MRNKIAEGMKDLGNFKKNVIENIKRKLGQFKENIIY